MAQGRKGLNKVGCQEHFQITQQPHEGALPECKTMVFAEMTTFNEVISKIMEREQSLILSLVHDPQNGEMLCFPNGRKVFRYKGTDLVEFSMEFKGSKVLHHCKLLTKQPKEPKNA